MRGGSTYERWLGRIVLVGVAVDILCGAALLLSPGSIVAWLRLPPEAAPQLWVRYAGLLLIALALAWMQAGLNPLRNPLLLAAALLARLLGAIFFAAAMVATASLASWPLVLVELLFLLLPLWLCGKAFRANLDMKP